MLLDMPTTRQVATVLDDVASCAAASSFSVEQRHAADKALMGNVVSVPQAMGATFLSRFVAAHRVVHAAACDRHLRSLPIVRGKRIWAQCLGGQPPQQYVTCIHGLRVPCSVMSVIKTRHALTAGAPEELTHRHGLLSAVVQTGCKDRLLSTCSCRSKLLLELQTTCRRFMLHTANCLPLIVIDLHNVWQPGMLHDMPDCHLQHCGYHGNIDGTKRNT